MKYAIHTILIGILLLVAPATLADAPSLPGLFSKPLVPAQDDGPTYFDSRDEVDVSAVASSTIVAPGEDLVIAIIFDHEPGWHIHTDEPVVPLNWERRTTTSTRRSISI